MALIAAGSAACGTAQATPQGKVQNAFTKLGGQKSVTLGLSFDATPDQIYAVFKGDDFTAADAKMLASLHLKLAVSSDKQFSAIKSVSTDKGSSVGLELSNGTNGDSSLIEIRSVGQKLYLRADIKGLAKLDTTGGGSAEVNQFLDHADQLPSSLGSVKAALKGQWIVIDPKAFTDYAKSMAGKTGGSGSADSPLGALTGAGTPKIDAKTQRQLVDAVRKALSHNVTYKDLGSRNGADHIQASVPARQLAKELSTSLTPILKQIPGVKPSDLNGFNDVSSVPNKAIILDVAVKGGSVSGLTFDLAQLDDKAPAGAKLPLALTLDDGADKVEAPKDAKQLNPQDILGLFMAGFPGSDDTASGSGYSDFSPSDDSSFSGSTAFDPSSIDLTGLNG